ncbi:hypothetical protein [Micromonospora sp. GCM10011541]|uniref:hypothetical protein n=1 Tax=Micromonospora sp. GCM10011541 TaxID=3317336 RepID=UPI003607569D
MSDYTPQHAESDPDLVKRTNRRKRIRTAFQTLISSAGVLLVVVPVAMEYLETSVDAKTYAALAGAALAITQGAKVVTRVMQAPAVNDFIDKHVPWLSADTEL